MQTNCPTCGAPAPDRDDPGHIYLVSDYDHEAMILLLTGRLDRARCEAGCELDSRTPIIFIDTAGGRVLIVAGDSGGLPIDWRELPEGSTVYEVADAAALRDDVISTLGARIAKLVGAVPADGDWIRVAADHWSSFTETHVAALCVALDGAVAQLDIDRFGTAGGPALDVEAFGMAQAWAWFTMCVAWGPLEDGDRFETDLERFIDRPPIVGRAAAFFCRILDSFAKPPEEWSEYDDAFRVEAARASLHKRFGLVNERADQWAMLWLLAQVWQREHDRDAPGLHVSLERARATIAHGTARNVVAAGMNGLWPDGLYADNGDERIMQRRHARQQVLESVLEELYPGAVGELFHRHLRVGEDLDRLADNAIASLHDTIASLHNVRGTRTAWYVATEFARQTAVPLTRAGRLADIRRVAGVMRAVGRRIARLGRLAVPSELAGKLLAVPSELAIELLAMDRPAEALATIKPYPRWRERFAPADVRWALAVVRANALSDLGRSTEALAALTNQTPELPQREDIAVGVIVTIARILPETGAVFQALETLEPALERWCDRYPPVGATMAATVVRLGRYSDAARHSRRAFEVAARDSIAYSKGRYAAMTIRHDVWAGHPPDSRLLAAVVETPLDQDPFSHLLAAAGLLERYVQHPDAKEIDGPDLDFLHATVEALPALTTAAAPSRSVGLAALAYHVRGLYLRRFDPDGELAAWLDPPDPGRLWLDSAPYAAECLIRHDDWPHARQILPLMLVGLTNAIGDDAETSAAPFGGGHHLSAVDGLTATALSSAGATTADLRTIGELRRETFGRRLSAPPARETADWRRSGFDDDIVRAIAPASGSVGVLEWITSGSRTRCLLTRVRADRDATGVLLDPPDVDLAALSERLGYRLSSWRPGRPGDPLDLADWSACVAWLTAVVDGHLADGDHLVFLPHPHATHLPWHSVASERVTSSYEPSWVSLLRTTAEPPNRRREREGVIVVPRLGDPAPVIDAMKAFTDAIGEGSVLLSGPAADRAAAEALLTSSDIVSVLAHGYSSSADGDVALMLAAHGRLPLAHSIAAYSTAGREHRYGWREYARLDRAPATLLSAACSSGTSLAVGAGDQIGLYAILRQAGLRSMIAPRWEIIAADVLPILAAVRHSVVTEGLGAGEALRRSVRAALASGVPRWSAFALALEGDWR